ncbi:MAG: hypothetical protein ACRDGV_13795 [Candidatus Limnocylindria bacterium]
MPTWFGPAALVLVLAGCGGGVATGAPPATSAALAPEQIVTCGRPGFPVSVIDGPGGAESADDPAAAALRDHLAQPGPDYDWLPDAGWKVARRDADAVLFIADHPGADDRLATVSVERSAGSWRVGGWAECRPQTELEPGLGPASWRLAPEVEPSPDVTEIAVLVTERSCASGRSSEGRIAEPAISYGTDAVTITFGVRPLPGGQDCPGNPEARVLVTLDEPLGDRALLG